MHYSIELHVIFLRNNSKYLLFWFGIHWNLFPSLSIQKTWYTPGIYAFLLCGIHFELFWVYHAPSHLHNPIIFLQDFYAKPRNISILVPLCLFSLLKSDLYRKANLQETIMQIGRQHEYCTKLKVFQNRWREFEN